MGATRRGDGIPLRQDCSGSDFRAKQLEMGIIVDDGKASAVQSSLVDLQFFVGGYDYFHGVLRGVGIYRP